MIEDTVRFQGWHVPHEATSCTWQQVTICGRWYHLEKLAYLPFHPVLIDENFSLNYWTSFHLYTYCALIYVPPLRKRKRLEWHFSSNLRGLQCTLWMCWWCNAKWYVETACWLINCCSFDCVSAWYYKNNSPNTCHKSPGRNLQPHHFHPAELFSYPEAPKELGAEQHDKYSKSEPHRPNPSALLVFTIFPSPSARHISTWCLLALPHYFYLLLDTVSPRVTSTQGELLSFIHSVG